MDIRTYSNSLTLVCSVCSTRTLGLWDFWYNTVLKLFTCKRMPTLVLIINHFWILEEELCGIILIYENGKINIDKVISWTLPAHDQIFTLCQFTCWILIVQPPLPNTPPVPHLRESACDRETKEARPTSISWHHLIGPVHQSHYYPAYPSDQHPPHDLTT